MDRKIHMLRGVLIFLYYRNRRGLLFVRNSYALTAFAGKHFNQSHQKRSNHTEQFILPEDLGWKLWSMKITYIGNNNLTYLGSNQPLHWQLKELDYYLILLSFRIFVLLLPFPSVLSGPERNFVLWEGKVNIIDCSITNYHCLQMLE